MTIIKVSLSISFFEGLIKKNNIENIFGDFPKDAKMIKMFMDSPNTLCLLMKHESHKFSGGELQFPNMVIEVLN